MDAHNTPGPPPAQSSTMDELNHSPTASQHSYNVVVIVAAMVCAIVCAVGLHSMLQCVVRCARRALTDPAGWIASRRLNSGLKRAEVVALPVAVHSTPAEAPCSPAAGCAVCLAEFSDGDKLRVMPSCRHRFHVGCIDTWLLSHSSCPTCRHRLSSWRREPPLPPPPLVEVVTAV